MTRTRFNQRAPQSPRPSPGHQQPGQGGLLEQDLAKLAAIPHTRQMAAPAGDAIPNIRGRGIAASLGQYAHGYPIDHTHKNGVVVTYYMKPLSEGAKAGLEMWAKKMAIQLRVDARDVLPPDVFDRQLAMLFRAMERGVYSFANPDFMQVVETLDGGVEVVRLMLMDSPVKPPPELYKGGEGGWPTQFVIEFLAAHGVEVALAQIALHPDLPQDKKDEILASIGRNPDGSPMATTEGGDGPAKNPQGDGGGGGPPPSPDPQ